MLLHTVIEQHSTEQPETKKNQKNAPHTVPNKIQGQSKHIGTLKGKRKDLSMALRHMIDTEQNNVVQMYKQIKKNQRLENVSKAQVA